jgi:hypothetical protein
MTTIIETVPAKGSFTMAITQVLGGSTSTKQLPPGPAQGFTIVSIDDGSGSMRTSFDEVKPVAGQPIKVSWACKAGSTTPGDGCAGISNSIVGLLAQTNLGPRNALLPPDKNLQFGVAQCTAPLPGGMKTLDGKAVTEILGGQTGGSVRFALVPLQYTLQPSGDHQVILTAGSGIFGFANQ